MADEICSIISAVRKEQSDPEKAGLVNTYLDIVEQTVTSQHQIIVNYEELVKKLEVQLVQCQGALDESTKREIEQIGLIMEFKMTQAMKDGDDEDEHDKDCETCDAYEKENQLLHQQNEQQQQIIERLGQAQELLMLQYKMLELGMDKELAKIAQTQEDLKGLKQDGDDDQDEESDHEEEDKAELEEVKQDQDDSNQGQDVVDVPKKAQDDVAQQQQDDDQATAPADHQPKDD
eukprot:403348432